MKKILAICVFLGLSMGSVQAQTVPPPTVAARAWLVLDATSNQVLGAQNSAMRIEPASLAKIMTAYLVFAAIKDKKLDANQQVRVSTKAWKVDPSSSKMFIDPATPVKISDLLYGLIVQSGNDAAVALAEAVAGSEETFVVMMNSEAARLGLKSTRFANSHGLPHPDNYTTAEDLSVLAQRLIQDYPEGYKIYSTRQYTYNKITQPNRNRLLWLDPSVDGMKTGHTSSAGFSLISSAHRSNGNGERRLISVVLGTNSDTERAQESQKLLNWGFQNFDTVKLYAKNQVVATPEVWKGTSNAVKIGFARDTYVTVPRGMAEKLKPVLERKTPLIAPIAQDSTVATLKMVADGKTVVELQLVALEQINQASLFGRAWDSVRLWIK